MEDYFDCEEVCPATLNPQFAAIPPENFKDYRLFMGHLPNVDIPKYVPDKHVHPVTVLREPVARVISHYDYIRRTPGDPFYAAVQNMTLEEFTRNLQVARLGKNIQVYHVARLSRVPLRHMTLDEVLDLAKSNLDKFPFVGLLERFQDSLYLLSYVFGWRPIINNRRENVSGASKAKLKEQISESTLEVIRESTRLDAELYDYAVGTFKDRFDSMVDYLLENHAAQLPDDLRPESKQQVTSDTIRLMLEAHAEARYRALAPAPVELSSYHFCQALHGSGWQRRERPENDPAYRWIGPEPTATLDIPKVAPSDRDYLIEIRVICTWALPADMLASLKLSINGHPVELKTLYYDVDVKLLQGKVPREAIESPQPFLRLQFDVNRVAPLKSFSPMNNDSRVVGVAINYAQAFLTTAERDRSAALKLFDDVVWQEPAKFLEQHWEPSHRIAAPLAFKAKLDRPITDVNEFVNDPSQFEWVVLHKGMIDKAIATVAKLAIKGFRPVFANSVFIIFSRVKGLPSMSYISPHVRSLYLGRIKNHLAFIVDKKLRRRLPQLSGQAADTKSSK